MKHGECVDGDRDEYEHDITDAEGDEELVEGVPAHLLGGEDPDGQEVEEEAVGEF